jgi:hypothetical protein
MGVSLRDRAVGCAETPAVGRVFPLWAPYAECSIMPSTRLYRVDSFSEWSNFLCTTRDNPGPFSNNLELSRLAILATGENNNAFPIRERRQLMVAQL